MDKVKLPTFGVPMLLALPRLLRILDQPQSARQTVIDLLVKFPRRKTPDYRVAVTDHSLGGAEATLAARERSSSKVPSKPMIVELYSHY